jgi:hypothetical protein
MSKVVFPKNAVANAQNYKISPIEYPDKQIKQ